MELRQLELVVALAEELHFGRAAARVHLSQPALTQALARLEVELGARLFDRSTRRVVVTPAGEELVRRGRSLLAQAGDAAEAVQRVVGGAVGTVRLGVVGTAMLDTFPVLVRAVRAAHPEIRVEVGEHTGVEQLRRLRTGQLDLGMLHLPPVGGPPGVELAPLRADQLALALPADHRLAHRRVVRLVELREDPLVTMRREVEADTQSLYLGACAEAGFAPRVEQEVTSLAALLGFVAAGFGWAFVPESVAHAASRAGVAFVGLRGVRATLPTTLAWLAGPAPSPAASRVRETMLAALRA